MKENGTGNSLGRAFQEARAMADMSPDLLLELAKAMAQGHGHILRPPVKNTQVREVSTPTRVLDMEPQMLPELRRDYVSWIRTTASWQWFQQHTSGAAFVTPPAVSTAPGVPDFDALASYYADVWENGKLFCLTPEMTTLAYRTQMEKYRLTLDALPAPAGVIFWQQPIGVAELSTIYDIPINTETGEVNTEEIQQVFTSFREEPSPIVAASWRYDPDHNLVWVVFHSDHIDFLANKLAEFTPEERARGWAAVAPIGFEREQALPLDKTFDWPHETEGGHALPLTAQSLAASIGPTEEIRAKGQQQNEEARAAITPMIRTLIASWMLMKWKIAHREEVVLPRPARKRMVRAGADRDQVERDARVQVIKLGAPISRKPTKGTGKGGKWKVRAIVGPVIRTRQYIPAWDTYDENPRLIEPYIAGPPDAPISNADKVFLLE